MSRNSICFLDGFLPRALEGFAPDMTVLNWLREEEGRIGTKEGCAEGDCGACTVVLARLEKSALRYRAVNACILFLPQLDGAQLITVDHLKGISGQLHPIQQAMVDHHASQCGFCTPGFVMSLFAFSKTNAVSTREQICDAIAGNLCRCTGYRPIVDAALEAMADGRQDQFDERKNDTIAALTALAGGRDVSVSASGKEFFAPQSLIDLADLAKKHPDAHFLAGGTDVGLWVTKQHQNLATVIDVTRVPELQEIEATKAHLKIGAAVTYSDAQTAIRDRWPAFGSLIRRIGGMQVREAGTIGGNIANGSPIGDTMPALIALGCQILLQYGSRQRVMQLEDFYLGYRKTTLEPGEFLREIRIPLPTPSLLFRCYKISKRFDQDISAVMAAFGLELSANGAIEKIRIGFGGMAAVPKRATETERAMLGKPWTEETITVGQAALAEEFNPISDMRASATYRMTVAQNLLRKFLMETSEPMTKTRVLNIV